GYGFTPGFEDYSEMNGYGMWRTASAWYYLMWSVLASALILLGVLFWDRGLGQNILKKLQLKSLQLNSFGKLTVFGLLIAFVFLQSFIYRQVNEKDNFELSKDADIEAASYERAFGFLQSKTHPIYTNIDLILDFFPQERRAEYLINSQITHTSPIPIDSVWLSLPDHVVIQRLNIDGIDLSSALRVDEIHNMVAFKLPNGLDSSASVSVQMNLTKRFEGFSQEEPQASLVYRGSFASIDDFLPFIGFDNTKILTENRARMEQELPRLSSLLPSLSDTAASKRNIYRVDASPLSGTLTMSTTHDQVLMGPGLIIHQEQKDERNYTTFQIKSPTPLNWCIGTAPYSIIENSGVAEVQIYHNPDHPYNSHLYQDIVEQSIIFIQENLGNYPFEKVRLYEIPHYQEPIYAFSNGIAISEKEGWIADTTGLKERAYLYQTTASGISQHWVQENLDIAHVEGADMLRLALPEALALQFVYHSLGEEAVELLIEQKRQIYNKDRFSDPNGEPALLYADGKDYLEANHGAITLYKWSKRLGFDAFNRLILDWSQQAKPATFESLYRNMVKGVSKENQEELAEDFETVASDS
ncbi:MAG: hypothetical protein AAGA10_26680, partial [Bacteroidota bacterium]